MKPEVYTPCPDLLQDDDPIIEYEDEFGRVRTGRRSEVPRHLLEPEEPAEEDIEYVTKVCLFVLVVDQSVAVVHM